MIVVAGFNVPNFHRYFVGASAITIIALLILVNLLRWATSIARAFKLLFMRCKTKLPCKKRKAVKRNMMKN